MFLALGVVALFGGVLGAVALTLFAGYRFRDLFVLAVLTAITLYLSRWDSNFVAKIHGRPLVGFHWLMMAILLVLAMMRVLCVERPPLGAGWALALMGLFSVFSMLSGMVNGQVEGLAAVFQILIISLVPFLVGWLLVDIVPRAPEASRRLRISFILLIGLITPAIQISSSLLPNVYGAILGWTPVIEGGSTGFVRGWSPLGSPIATGITMVLAYGLAMHEVIGCRRRIFAVALAMIGLSVLFTLARSVLAMLVVFHVVYFWSTLRRYPMRVLGLCLVAFVVMTPVIIKLSQRYSFDRFLLFSDESTDIRTSSAVAALRASVRSPLLGHGPGLLYDEIRTDWLADSAPAGATDRVTFVEDELSALEPHNMYLLLAAEHGWPAMLLFVGAMLYCWQRVRVGRWVTNDADRSMAAALGALWLSSLVVLVTYSGPLVNPQASIFFWFLAFAGLHWRATALGASRPWERRAWKPAHSLIVQPAG